MEKALFPLKYMKQTQGVNGSYSHKGTYAIDFGNHGEKENLYAPFTGTIKKIYTKSGNGVWLESVDKVLWANGTIDYMTVLTMHDDDVSDLKIGQKINQGEVYYQQGSAGDATGVHVHLEVAKGKFFDSGWHENANGIWVINNAVHPVDALFLTDDVVIDNDGGYNWRRITGSPVVRDNTKDQIEVIVDNLRCRKNPNGEIMGYINKGFYDIMDKKHNGEYDWYKIEEDKWVAYNPAWTQLYLKQEESDNELQNLKDKIEVLELENSSLKEKIQELENNNAIKFSYACLKDDMYAIKLYKGETIYIK